MNIRRNVAEVFGKKWQASQLLTQPVEEIVPRTIYPAAVHGSVLGSGNLPELCETTKVIKADVVTGLCGPAQALHPPSIAVRPHRAPVIKWIAPTLASRTVGIGRDSRHHFGIEFVIQTKKIAIGPHVGAFVIHEDSDIANHAHRPLGAIASQGAPLLIEEELQD